MDGCGVCSSNVGNLGMPGCCKPTRFDLFVFEDHQLAIGLTIREF